MHYQNEQWDHDNDQYDHNLYYLHHHQWLPKHCLSHAKTSMIPAIASASATSSSSRLALSPSPTSANDFGANRAVNSPLCAIYKVAMGKNCTWVLVSAAAIAESACCLAPLHSNELQQQLSSTGIVSYSCSCIHCLFATCKWLYGEMKRKSPTGYFLKQ